MSAQDDDLTPAQAESLRGQPPGWRPATMHKMTGWDGKKYTLACGAPAPSRAGGDSPETIAKNRWAAGWTGELVRNPFACRACLARVAN